MAYGYGPVVVGVDGSPHSMGAMRWAADEACRHTRTLLAVHALPEPAAEAHPPGIAAAAATEAQRWRVGVAAVGTTEIGPAVTVLRRYSAGARLLVVGSHGSGGTDKGLGSVSEALGVQADCPVLIVLDAQRWADPDAVLPGNGPVIVGFDGSDSARRALRLAFEEAASRCSRLVIVQAWHHQGLWQPGQRHGADLSADETAVHDALRAAAAPWCVKYPAVELEIRSEPGDTVQALTVASQWAVLMVLGTRCPTDAVQPSKPSVMRRVLHHAACPLLIAHGPSRLP